MGKLSYPSTVGYLRNGRCHANTTETTASIATVMAPARRKWIGKCTSLPRVVTHRILRALRRKPGTDTKFPAQFAGNWLSVPGFALRETLRLAVSPQSRQAPGIR